MKTLTKNELKDMNRIRHEDFMLVNVLSPEYFNKRHIRTSINIPHEGPDFARTVEKVAGSKDRTVIVYCASFECDASKKAAEKLESAGFTDVYAYEGGTKDWFAGKEQRAA